MDEVEQNGPKKNKTSFSVGFPIDLNNKIEYIKKRTYLSKQRIVLMLCAKGIEAWCKSLMEEEIALRTAAVPKVKAPQRKVTPSSVPTRAPSSSPGYTQILPAPNLYVPASPPPLHKYEPPPGVGWPLPPAPTVVNKATYPGGYDPWTVPLDKEEKDK